MEYDDAIVNAFLARIDKRNCADYGLTDFASESCSLPVIKVLQHLTENLSDAIGPT